MVSAHLKNIHQIGSSPRVGVKIKIYIVVASFAGQLRIAASPVPSRLDRVQAQNHQAGIGSESKMWPLPRTGLPSFGSPWLFSPWSWISWPILFSTLKGQPIRYPDILSWRTLLSRQFLDPLLSTSIRLSVYWSPGFTGAQRGQKTPGGKLSSLKQWMHNRCQTEMLAGNGVK